MPKNKRKQNKQNDAQKSDAVIHRPKVTVENERESICYEYGVFGLDIVDCDILLGLETDEKRNAYLKKRFPEGT